MRQLFVAGCDAPKVFELAGKALNQVPFFVKMRVVEALPETIAFGRDDRDSATSLHCGDNSVGVVGLVRNDMLSRQTFDQFDGRNTVVDLAAGQFRDRCAILVGDLDEVISSSKGVFSPSVIRQVLRFLA